MSTHLAGERTAMYPLITMVQRSISVSKLTVKFTSKYLE